jgi:exonuclease III
MAKVSLGATFWWSGEERGRNGVGIMIGDQLINKTIGIKYINGRKMKLQLMLGGEVVNIIQVYASQVVCSKQEMEEFGNMLEDVITNRKTVIRGDLNAQFGSDRTGYEQVVGCFGNESRNEDGERLGSPMYEK